MRNSVTFFRIVKTWAVGVFAALSILSAVGDLQATVLITVEEALDLAFPEAEATRETLFLTEGQLSSAAVAAEVEIGGAMVTRFVVRRDGEVVGFAYVDTHRVRTLPETLLVVLAADGSVRRVEVAAFREPLDYKPGDAWYRQFDDEELDRNLSLNRDIRPITGATLTARATTDAVRRVLAIHSAVTGNGESP